MAVNKVMYGNQTLIDLSTDTVSSSDDILLGKVGHLRDGSVVTGTASGGDQHGTIWQDGQGYVHLDDESGIALQSKSVTPSESQQVIEADEGYYALDTVTVGAISSSYVGSGVSRRSSSDLTASGATVTAPAGYYSAQASKSVATGTAGTPTATKGTVSNHAVTVTPKVTNTTGYISGGTKTGTGISVSASELVSGTYSVTSAGVKDVANYSAVDVPAGSAGTPTATKGSVSNNSVTVTPSVTNTTGFIGGTTKTGTAVTVSASELVSGTKSITENGTGIDVTNYASVDVAVGGNDFVVTFTKNQSGKWTPNHTYTEVIDAYNAGKTVGGRTNGTEGVGFEFYNDDIYYTVSELYSGLDGTGIKQKAYYWSFGGITEQGETITYDTIFADAVPSDVASGKVFYNSQGEQTGTASGGTSEPVDINDPVRFFDYDGTLVHSYSASDFQALTAMPANPYHSGLTAQGWNWTLADAKAQLTAMGACDIGQMYVTDDGKTRIYVHMDDGRLHPYLGICPNGTVTVDWGDGTSTNTLTGTSTTAVKVADHTYSSSGDYIITLTVSSGKFAFFGVSNTPYIFRKDDSTTANIHLGYLSCIQKIELGNNAVIGNYAFRYCRSLETITLPEGCFGTNTMSSYTFQECSNLRSVTIPSGVTTIGSYGFTYTYAMTSISIPKTVTLLGNMSIQDAYTLSRLVLPEGLINFNTYSCYGQRGLKSIKVPNGVTSISNNLFATCYCLTSVTVPSGLQSIGSSAFSNCHALANITIPSGVTSIGSYAFTSCYGLGEIHFKPTTPPTVSNANAFNNLPTDCIIYVPTGTLSTYTSATNYPSSETYTYVEE